MVSAEDLVSGIERETSAEDLIGVGRKSIKGKFKLKTKKFKLKPQVKVQKKFKRIAKRTGKGLLKIGKKVTPIVKKQVRLIRQQQLRDEAIERKLSKRKPTKKIKTYKQTPMPHKENDRD